MIQNLTFLKTLDPKLLKYLRQLLAKILIFSACNIPILIIYFSIDYYHNQKEQDTKDLEVRNLQLNTQIIDLEQKINNINQTKDLAVKLKDNFFINKVLNFDKVNQKIIKLTQTYHLVSRPSVVIKPITEQSPLLKLALKNNNNNIKVDMSEISIEISAYDDISLFQFIEDLIDEFDGIIKITNFEIKKNKDLDNATIEEISKGNKSAIVTAKITMLWHTIKIDKPNQDNKMNNQQNTQIM